MPQETRSVLFIYGTRPISTESKSSVARLLAETIELIRTEYPKWKLVAVCPAGGKAQATFRQFDLTLADRFVRRITRLREGAFWSDKAARLIARETAPDLIICAAAHAAIAARKYLPGAKIIYWIHSMPDLDEDPNTLQAIAVADAVVVPTRALYNALWNLYNRKFFPAPVWVISNRIDCNLFVPAPPQSRATRREKWGLSEQDFAVVHVGGTSVHKGRHIIEQALLLNDNIDRKITLFSAGGSVQARRFISSEIEVIDVGKLPPEEMAQLYQICDLGVIPSLCWENAPLALIEMMSTGLCVLASNSGGIPEIIRNDVNGMLITEPNNVLNWAALLHMLIENDELRNRLGSEARKTACQQFDINSYVAPEAWLKLIKTITRSQKPSFTG